MSEDPKIEHGTVIHFEPEELRQMKAAAESLADMAEAERTYWMPKRAEEIGVPERNLKKFVHVILVERSKRVAAERLEQDRERKRQLEERAAEQRELGRKSKEERKAKEAEDKHKRDVEKAAEREQQKAAKEAEKAAEREQKAAEKATLQKAKDKAKALGIVAQLPTAQHELELGKLAERLGEDIAVLRDEFKEFLGVGAGMLVETEPWHEPVELATVLHELSTKVSRYVVMQPHQTTAAVLWVAHTWTYRHKVPTHSPLLAATSAEKDSGKTTLMCVLGRACPRFSLNIEMTGPSLFRFVDQIKPTLVIDEADDLFKRKVDLKHVINAGWTVGATSSSWRVRMK